MITRRMFMMIPSVVSVFMLLVMTISVGSSSSSATANRVETSLPSPTSTTTTTTTTSRSISFTSSPEISTDTDVGRHLLSKARRLEDQQNDDEFNYGWVSSYSIKFQGCHHIRQWNDDVDDENDVRIVTKRLVRFRLCPTEYCSVKKIAGCSSGYGDYIIDLETFLDAYLEAQRQAIEYQCQYYLRNSCGCDNDDADEQDKEYCEYDCYNDAGMTQCIDDNPYVDDDNNEEEFNVEEYAQCQRLDVPEGDDDNNRRRALQRTRRSRSLSRHHRRLEDNGDDDGGDDDGAQQQEQDEEEEDIEYYVGPYCSENGDKVLLGLFTDDTCSTNAGDNDYDHGATTFEYLMGYELPYSSDTILGSDCLECVERRADEEEQNDNNNNNQDNNNDQQDADEVSESCEILYEGSGKCEANLPYGMISSDHVNNNACNYIEGVRIIRKDGIIDTGVTRPNAVATAFIVIFAMAFAAMAFYVWYLRTRLGVKQHSLL